MGENSAFKLFFLHQIFVQKFHESQFCSQKQLFVIIPSLLRINILHFFVLFLAHQEMSF